MKYRLYFEDDNYQRILIAACSEVDIIHFIYEDAATRFPNFKIYYVRSFVENNITYYDFGSHSSYYVAIPII